MNSFLAIRFDLIKTKNGHATFEDSFFSLQHDSSLYNHCSLDFEVDII